MTDRHPRQERCAERRRTMAENREVDKKIQTNAETINKVPYDDYSDFGVEEIRELLGKEIGRAHV